MACHPVPCLFISALILSLVTLLVNPCFCVPARKLVLVPTPSTILSYHHGPLLTQPINLHFLWYGSFTPSQKATLVDFASSFSSASVSSPSVASWWSIVSSYTDLSHGRVSSSVSLATQTSVPSPSPPTVLKRVDILSLLTSSLSSKALPVDSKGLYFVFTADDIPVEDFCMSSCGYHDSTPASSATKNLKLAYAWVGNPAKQCPGFCAWPYAPPPFGPQTSLVSPNKDVGMAGMVINMATVLAGAATNPYDTGYYQGEAGAPLEAASACAGTFGKGAYPGYPGSLLIDEKTKGSYNAHGANGRLFLLPAVWSPSTQKCTTLT